MNMQALTPEQAKMLWGVAGDIGKWVVSGITLAVLGWIGKTLKALPDKIIAPVTARLDAHEELDTSRFAVREAFEAKTVQALADIQGHQRRVSQSHGG